MMQRTNIVFKQQKSKCIVNSKNKHKQIMIACVVI